MDYGMDFKILAYIQHLPMYFNFFICFPSVRPQTEAWMQANARIS